MIPKGLVSPPRTKGWKSPNEVERRKKEIISLFEDEKDQKTFTQVVLKAKKIGWSETSVHRYLHYLVNERRLFKEGDAEEHCIDVTLLN